MSNRGAPSVMRRNLKPSVHSLRAVDFTTTYRDRDRDRDRVDGERASR